jgi:hypothetical protein
MDLASLGALPRYTCGQLYYYPAFNARRDHVSSDSRLQAATLILCMHVWEAGLGQSLLQCVRSSTPSHPA